MILTELERVASRRFTVTHARPSAVQVWEGQGVVKTGRVMLGETNPANSLPGTIRGDFCIDVGR